MTWLAVAVGGALGSLARHTVNLFFAHLLESAVPYATAAVNLIGSFVIGLLAGLIAHGRLSLDQVIRSPRAKALGWNPSLRSVGGNAARLLEEWRAERAQLV